MPLQDLLWLIQNNPISDGRWYQSEWESCLLKISDWIEVIQDSVNWPAIEKVRPKKYYDELCGLLVKIAGLGLVKRWFHSQNQNQQYWAKRWLRDISNLTSSNWNELPDEIKIDIFGEYVFSHTFYDDKLLSRLERLNFEISHCIHSGQPIPQLECFRELISYTLPIHGYVMPKELCQLRLIVEMAGDAKYLNVIEERIAQQAKACMQYSYSQIFKNDQSYNPTRSERELIARIMDKMRMAGFTSVALPRIVLSFETPPLFVAYPELEENEQGRDRDLPEYLRELDIPRNRDRRHPETISVEEVLGCYTTDPKITLYARGFSWYGKNNRLDEVCLRAVVLVHEVAHWVSHLLPKSGILPWPKEHYIATETDIHEGWAQLITWWIIHEVGGELQDTFEKLNRTQSSSYRIYQRFINKPATLVIGSLEELRNLGRPAKLEDWERILD